MQSTFVDFELQFRSLLQQTTTQNIKHSKNGAKSAYNTKRRKKKSVGSTKSSSTSPLAEAGRTLFKQTDFFADYGKPLPPSKRLSLRELEEKRLSLPFIDTIEFIRLNLERRGIHSREKKHHQQQRKPETTMTVVEDFDMDISEFMDPLSSTNIQHRRQQRHQHQHQHHRHPQHPPHRKQQLPELPDPEIESRPLPPLTFSPVVTRARFPIFTDFLGLAKTKVAKRPIPWLLQLIEEIYDARYRFDCAQLSKQIQFKITSTATGLNRPPPLNTPTFVYQHLEKQLGLKQLINSTAWDILYNMEVLSTQQEQQVQDQKQKHTLPSQHIQHMYPEVRLFQQFLRQLITSEHVLFFLHCRHLIQTEHEIQFVTRGKINTTTCSPVRN